MVECVTPAWQYWMIAGLVTVTAVIVWVATWTYMQDRYMTLLRDIAMERASNAAALQDVRIRQQVYGKVTMGDLEHE